MTAATIPHPLALPGSGGKWKSQEQRSEFEPGKKGGEVKRGLVLFLFLTILLSY